MTAAVPSPGNAGNLDSSLHFGIQSVARPARKDVFVRKRTRKSVELVGASFAQFTFTVQVRSLLGPRFAHAMMPVVRFACSSFATLARAPSSRLRAPGTSSRLLTTPSGTPSENPQPTPRSRGPPSAAHASAPRQRTSPPPPPPTPPPPQSLPPLSPPSSSPGKRPLLQPYELSRRLIALCEQGKVDLAFSVLQQAPRNAQNIKVWNTIVQQCMDAKKYNLAYSVFTDVRP
jgi:hypothetical protein